MADKTEYLVNILTNINDGQPLSERVRGYLDQSVRYLDKVDGGVMSAGTLVLIHMMAYEIDRLEHILEAVATRGKGPATSARVPLPPEKVTKAE